MLLTSIATLASVLELGAVPTSCRAWRTVAGGWCCRAESERYLILRPRAAAVSVNMDHLPHTRLDLIGIVNLADAPHL